MVEAEQQYRKGYQAAEGYARAAHQLAWFLAINKGRQELNQGKPHDAEESFREAIRLWPTFALAYNDLAYVLIADSNRWVEAERLIKKSLDLASAEDKPYCLDTLGELLAKQPQRRAEAVAAYQQALAGFTKAGDSNEVKRVHVSLSRLDAH